MIRALAVIAVSFLFGCASDTYIPPAGMTREQAERIMAACEAGQTFIPNSPPDPRPPNSPGQGYMNFGIGLSDIAARERYFENCVRAQGIKKQGYVNQNTEKAATSSTKFPYTSGENIPTTPTNTPIASSAQNSPPPGLQNQKSEQEQASEANKLWDAKRYLDLVAFGDRWTLTNANSPNAWYYLGLGYYGLGAKEKALPSFREALRLKPDLPETLARTLIARGEMTRVAEIYVVLAQIDASRAEAFKAMFLTH